MAWFTRGWSFRPEDHAPHAWGRLGAFVDGLQLAVLLALRRRAAVDGRRLTFASVPPMLDSLARVYGLEEILGA